MKSDGNEEKYVEKKKLKIKTLEEKLSKIRECALFLGDMSEMHRKTISKNLFSPKLIQRISSKRCLKMSQIKGFSRSKCLELGWSVLK